MCEIVGLREVCEMTRRLFVCHATADIEATSELVDALENALSFSAGSVWTSSLPGYSAELNDMPALGAALAGSDVVLALVTQTSVHDAQFHFQLGAAWALGAHTVLFLLDPTADEALPSALNQASIMRGHEPSQWSELIGDLSVRLGLVPRPGASNPPVLTPSSPPPAPKSAPPPPAATHASPAAALPGAATPTTSPAHASASLAQAAPSASTAHAGAAPAGAAPASAAIPHASTSSPTHAAASSTHADAAIPSASSPSADTRASTGHTQADAAAHADEATPSAPVAATQSASTVTAHAAAAATAAQLSESAASASHVQVDTPSAAAAHTDIAAPASPAQAGEATTAAAPAHSSAPTATARSGANTPTGSATHADTAAAGGAAAIAGATATNAAPARIGATTPAHAADSSQATARRADETPLPAAVAKIANASARTPGATTALHTASAQIAASKAQQPAAAAASKAISVPPLPGARPASVPPLPPRSAGVPPLPAAVPSSLIVPPPPTSPDQEASEPTTTPKAPIIILNPLPEAEPEPAQTTASQPTKPQPRAAAAYPSVTPQQSYLDELRSISDPTERTPPRYSYVDELETLDPEEEYSAAASGYEALPSDDEEEPETREQRRLPARAGDSPEAQAEAEQASDSDVFARLPTCEMALEAGRAVSDCLFNRDEISNFTVELDAPLGGLIESLGASWTELSAEQDLDTWVAVTDHLLQTLPDEVRKLEEWYRVGFELATLHNLAGQLVLDGSDAAAEQHWRGALERFLMRAERAEIGYENLGRVLGLLENLVGPSHERDLSNIPRSLEELRRYAAGADIHTAA